MPIFQEQTLLFKSFFPLQIFVIKEGFSQIFQNKFYSQFFPGGHVTYPH